MKTYTAEQVAAITNGILLCGDPQTEITNIQQFLNKYCRNDVLTTV